MRLATVQKRNAFTLVELLVVIAIIVILMALTVGVISKVYVYLDEVKVNTEVGRMAQACEQFKSTFGRYPPSKIMLCENPVNYGGFAPTSALGQLAAYSSEYLSSAFPGLLTSGSTINWAAISGGTTGRIFVLEGQESLVYFLGGVRANGTGAPLGFNTDKSRLVDVNTRTRLGPFFEFETSRLADSTPARPVPNSQGFFQVYRDVYGTPYLYFAQRGGNMNNYYHFGAPQLVNNPATGTPYSAAERQILADCTLVTSNPTATFQMAPLWQDLVRDPATNAIVGIKYFKSDTYQIISAGKDKLFGSGGRWNQKDPETSTFGFMNFPTNAVEPTSPVTDIQATYDNITNVTGGRVVPK